MYYNLLVGMSEPDQLNGGRERKRERGILAVLPRY
jgi:hypothetical protein